MFKKGIIVRKKLDPGDGTKRLPLKGEGKGFNEGEEIYYSVKEGQKGKLWAVVEGRVADGPPKPDGATPESAGPKHPTLDEGSTSVRAWSGGGGPGTGKTR